MIQLALAARDRPIEDVKELYCIVMRLRGGIGCKQRTSSTWIVQGLPPCTSSKPISQRGNASVGIPELVISYMSKYV